MPKPLLEQFGLGEGSTVELNVENGRLIIEPDRAGVNLPWRNCWKESRPMTDLELVDWGPPVGREVW